VSEGKKVAACANCIFKSFMSRVVSLEGGDRQGIRRRFQQSEGVMRFA
jgi:hypothetical protein